MLNLRIDIPDSLAQEFNLSSEHVDGMLDLAVKDIAAKVANAWRQEAGRELGSSRQQYVDSIIEVDLGPKMASIELVGEVPNMIEEGAESWDMKPAFLRSSKAKMGENGRYLTIPFDIGTPDALPENFSTIMPEQVYEVILSKPQDIQTADGMRSTGLTDNEIPAPFNEPKTKQVSIPKSKTFGTYKHKSSIYAGTTRQKSNVTGQNTYTSFRRVSEKSSDPLSWIHPGIEAKKLAEKCLSIINVPYEVGRVIDRILKSW